MTDKSVCCYYWMSSLATLYTRGHTTNTLLGKVFLKSATNHNNHLTRTFWSKWCLYTPFPVLMVQTWEVVQLGDLLQVVRQFEKLLVFLSVQVCLHERSNLNTHTLIMSGVLFCVSEMHLCVIVCMLVPSVRFVGSWESSCRCRRTWWCSSCCKTRCIFPRSLRAALPEEGSQRRWAMQSSQICFPAGVKTKRIFAWFDKAGSDTPIPIWYKTIWHDTIRYKMTQSNLM